MTVEEFNRIKREIESLQKQADQALWKIEEIRSRLYKEFNCKGVGEASILLQNLQRKNELTELAFRDMKEKFKEKYGGRL